MHLSSTHHPHAHEIDPDFGWGTDLDSDRDLDPDGALGIWPDGGVAGLDGDALSSEPWLSRYVGASLDDDDEER